MVAGANFQSRGTYDLKNPNFRYMTTPQSPPGSLHTNPTETYFDAQTVPTGDQQGQRAAPVQQQVPAPVYPQVMRSSSSVQPGGYPHNHHLPGVLQTGTDVIPVVNGSIVSPSVQHQLPQGGDIQLAPPPAANPSHSPSPLYVQYQYEQHQGRPLQQWSPDHHSTQTTPRLAAHQHGMGSGVDFRTGASQHGTGTVHYELGSQHAHNMNGVPGGNVMYQQPKWSPQQQTLLQAVASRS